MLMIVSECLGSIISKRTFIFSLVPLSRELFRNGYFNKMTIDCCPPFKTIGISVTSILLSLRKIKGYKTLHMHNYYKTNWVKIISK